MDYPPAIARRKNLSLDLEEILETHAPEVVDAVGSLVAPVLAPGESSDLTTPLEHFRRKMAWVRGNMTEAEDCYRESLERDSRLCTYRDVLVASVVQNLLRIRQTCLGWLSQEGLEVLGLAGRIAKVDGAEAVLNKAREASKCLRRPGLDTASVEGPDLEMWLPSMAASLEPEIQELSRTLTAIEDERERTEEALDHRKQMVEAFDHDYLAIGRLAEAILRMAGLDEAADRIHPSKRQLERKSADE